MPNHLKLSSTEARKCILQTQHLGSRRDFGQGAQASLKAIEHLGYVQIDTLSVVARAHLHTLWNRVAGFNQSHIDELLKERKIFEHWAHALAILPIRDYRFALPMMNRIASGAVHWYPKNSKHTKRILRRIRDEGPLAAKDFADRPSSKEMWARSPSKLALEQLFMEGELMISERRNFHKVYDLRERVLPDYVDTRTPSEEEYCRHLISSYLRSQGMAKVKETIYLRKGIAAAARVVARQMLEEGLLQTVEVAGQEYYCLSDALQNLDKKAASRGLRILNPFDNMVIQRQRLKELFRFDYQIECYVPKGKRNYGYFCLPILQGNRLVARMDAKASRKDGVFHILRLHLEESVKSPQKFYQSLEPELNRFMQFNNCETLQVHQITGNQQIPDWQ